MARPREASKGALVLINKTDFTSVTSQTIDNIFTSTYTNYRIIYEVESSNSAINFALRANGSTDTNASYAGRSWYFIYGGATTLGTYTNSASGTSFNLGTTATSTNRASYSFDLFNPKASEYTTFVGQGTSEIELWYSMGAFKNTTSFDGILINAGGNSMTGSISIYGYRK